MGTSLELHGILVNLLGSNNVYFQPPESLKLSYPCIIYSKSSINSFNADNKNYILNTSYQITYIYRDPDDTFSKELLNYFSKISFERHFCLNNLNHDILKLYF